MTNVDWINWQSWPGPRSNLPSCTRNRVILSVHMDWESGLGAGGDSPWGKRGAGQARLSLWGAAPVGHTGWSETSGSIRTHFLAYTFLFISLFLPTLLPAFARAKTSNGILNKSGASRHHCPVPDLREKAFSLLSFHFLPYDLRCSFLCICSLPCWGSCCLLSQVFWEFFSWMLNFAKCLFHIYFLIWWFVSSPSSWSV